MKRIIAFLAAVILAAGLTACGGEKVPPGSGESAGRENVVKVDANVFIPDDTYVIYKESSTKTGVELFYEYNSNGHVTKIAHTYPDGRVEDELYEYTYNSDGSYSFHKTGWGSEYTRSFDEKGRITEEVRSPGSQ